MSDPQRRQPEHEAKWRPNGESWFEAHSPWAAILVLAVGLAVRLAAAYTNSGKYDDSSALLDKVAADPAASAPIKKAAQAEKLRAEKAKAAQK